MKKYIIILLFTMLIACQNNTKKENKNDKNHKEHTHDEHTNEGHSHDGHYHEGHSHEGDNSKADKQNIDCRNCGMPALEFPKSNVKATKENGKTVFFCSPRCYLEAGLAAEGKKELATFEKVEVANYLYPELRIPFAEVIWVIESGQKGPMGEDLFAFTEKNNAEKFIQKSKKGRIVTSDALEPELVKQLLKK